MGRNMTQDSATLQGAGRKSFFSFPLEIRKLIYGQLLLSPIPLPPTPPQSRQHVFTAILRTNRRIYLEAIDILYKRNFFTIHLRSQLHQIAYEPFLSNLSMANAAKITQLEIVLWGNYKDDSCDTVSFGTENFGITLQNLIYAPRLVVSIDLVETKDGAQEEDPNHASRNFCAFDWLMATFANEWYFNNTYFDLFRAVARFHMNQIFPKSRIKTGESRWFSEARATPSLRMHEQRRLWELEERYGILHDDDHPGYANEHDTIRSDGADDDTRYYQGVARRNRECEENETEDGNGINARSNGSDDGHSRPSA